MKLVYIYNIFKYDGVQTLMFSIMLPTLSLVSHSMYISLSPEQEVPSTDRRKEPYKKINRVLVMTEVQCYPSGRNKSPSFSNDLMEHWFSGTNRGRHLISCIILLPALRCYRCLTIFFQKAVCYVFEIPIC